MHIEIKRAYTPTQPGDGYRVLVDRLWPRGVSKQDLNLDAWSKEVAPSSELRRWFGHDPEKWEEFRERYLKELKQGTAARDLLDSVTGERLTLVYAARDTAHNHALVLQEYLKTLISK
ncbi:MAG: DUF488 domain-containing protein [Geobacteraceae bacterium]|nr:DUF488 domain-containing protein [Geobacteraceae bacterium]